MADMLNISETEALDEKKEKLHRQRYSWAVGAPIVVLILAFVVGIVTGAINGNNGAATSSLSATEMAVVTLVTMLGILIAENYLFTTLRIEKQARTLAKKVALEVVAKEVEKIRLEVGKVVNEAEAAGDLAASRDEDLRKRIESLEESKKKKHDREFKKVQDQVQAFFQKSL